MIIDLKLAKRPMKRRNQIGRRECPKNIMDLALRRMLPFVRHAAIMSQGGTLDLINLAASAYIQGAVDAFEAAANLADNKPNSKTPL